MALLVPDVIFKDVTHISLEFLRELGVQGLVLDVDNTLTGHGSYELRPDVAAWLETIKGSGIKLMLASNNTRERVAPFAEKLGLDYASFCCKPLPLWIKAAQDKWGLPRGSLALVGDQLFTDHLAGSLWGVRVFLVRPMYKDSKPTIRLKRMLERPFLKKYYDKGGKIL
ncbi:YqeG family HAD IIIA-type phosphatase [Ruminococcaceae bacterium OttesenSCG-928-D13]|nr:YqeG family HAD IIIA-type phosphatase [Ruminococcaceae bacterium OttesenSCG-928-D13]